MAKVTKKELLKVLLSMDLGGRIIINGKPFLVDEVVEYEEDGEKWLNLVNYQPNGLELALEIEGRKISLWQQIKGGKEHVSEDAVWYHSEKYDLDKEESGVAWTVLRKLVNGKKIAKKADTPYSIFVAASGRRLCREIWDGKECWYLSEPGLITISF